MSTSPMSYPALASITVASLVALSACGGDQRGNESPGHAGSGSSGVATPTHDSVTHVNTDDQRADQWDGDELPPGGVQEPVDDLTDLRYLPWGEYEEIDQNTLRFHVFMGNPSCYGLQYEVEETEEEVAVAVISGTREGVDVCTDDGFFGALDVPLDQPLGERAVVDLSERLAGGE